MTETKLERRRPPKFELIGGNLCLDFINTLDDRPSAQPKDLLRNYYELLRFSEDTGILAAKIVDFFFENVHEIAEDAADALRRAINLREAMYEVFSALMNRKAVPQAAMDALNAYIQDAALHSRLVPDEGRCAWRFDKMGANLDAMLWPIARAAADLLVSSDLALFAPAPHPPASGCFSIPARITTAAGAA